MDNTTEIQKNIYSPCYPNAGHVQIELHRPFSTVRGGTTHIAWIRHINATKDC